MTFQFRRNRDAPVLVIALLFASMFTVIILPARAAAPTPTIANDARCTWASGFTYNCTLTIANVGDTITVMGGVDGTTQGTNPVISGVSSTKAGNPTLLNKNFALQKAESVVCVGDIGFCGGVGGSKTGVESAWTAIANTTGSATIVITLSANANVISEAQAYDVEFSNSTPSAVVGSQCNATNGGDCGNPVSGGLTSGASDILLVSVTTYGNSAHSASGGCTFIGDSTTNFGGSFQTGAATCGVNFNTNSGANSGYAVVAMTWSAATTTVTTTINTNCLGACSSGANSTGTYFSTAMPTLFVFYGSQNTPSPGQIDNFTMKVKAVHINSASGNLLVGIYSPLTPTSAPSGGNQYSLIKSITVPISNGTTDFFVHVNPQANICASCFYAAGIMSTTTASRGSGATGSGVSFYETSGATSQQFSFNPGAAALPLTFFSSTVQKPNFFMFIHEIYTVATITSTSTLTLSGLVTSTTTVTTTSTNIINQLDMSKAGFWFIPLLFLLLPMGLLITVKRVADGRS